jgi:hypothetical protein
LTWADRYYYCTDHDSRTYEIRIKIIQVYSITRNMREDYLKIPHDLRVPAEQRPKEISTVIDIQTEYTVTYKPTLWQRIKDVFQRHAEA